MSLMSTNNTANENVGYVIGRNNSEKCLTICLCKTTRTITIKMKTYFFKSKILKLVIYIYI